MYLGPTSNEELNQFVAELPCQALIIHADLVEYWRLAKCEFEHPIQQYVRKPIERAPNIAERVSALNSNDHFEIQRVVEDRDQNRIYIRATDTGTNSSWRLLRDLLLPHISTIDILKVRTTDTEEEIYILRASLNELEIDVHPHRFELDDYGSAPSSDIQDEAGQTTRTQTTLARIGQGRFREQLEEDFQCCPVSGIRTPQLLIASHIKPWKSSNNNERLDPQNGLLLSATIDKLFDRKLIAFEPVQTNTGTWKGRMKISSLLSSEDLELLGLENGYEYDLHLSPERREYLQHHLQNFRE